MPSLNTRGRRKSLGGLERTVEPAWLESNSSSVSYQLSAPGGLSYQPHCVSFSSSVTRMAVAPTSQGSYVDSLSAWHRKCLAHEVLGT